MVGPLEVTADEVVVVVIEMVVDGAADFLFETSSPVPVSTSARSTAERTIRKRQRGWGKEFGEFRICSSP